jgi:Na+-transporting methylmalonyl-CoA/oxaloacetate decarboxylase beta subunit
VTVVCQIRKETVGTIYGSHRPIYRAFDANNKVSIKNDSSIGIIGGADGPTAIYVSGNPLKTMMVPAILLAVILFAVGFAVGYIVKGKRQK